MDPISKDQVTLFRTQNFSGKVAGVHDLMDTDPTPFMPINMIVMLRAVSGFVSVPTVSIGTNAPDYNNILPASALTGLDAIGEYFRLALGTQIGTTGTYRGMSPSSSVAIKANVTSAAVATTYDVEVQIVGAYV